MNQSLQYFQRQVLIEDREVILQFAFLLVTGRNLDLALNKIVYECVKENTACGKYHGTGDPEEILETGRDLNLALNKIAYACYMSSFDSCYSYG